MHSLHVRISTFIYISFPPYVVEIITAYSIKLATSNHWTPAVSWACHRRWFRIRTQIFSPRIYYLITISNSYKIYYINTNNSVINWIICVYYHPCPLQAFSPWLTPVSIINPSSAIVFNLSIVPNPIHVNFMDTTIRGLQIHPDGHQ